MSGEIWIKKMYDETSNVYDERYREIQIFKYNLVYDDIKGEFKTILDVGCGTGLLSLFLRDKGILSSSTLVGIDISPGMVSRAKGRGYDLLVVGNAENLPFPSGRFDLVVSFTLVQNIRDVDRFLDEIARVSKEGAKIILSILRKSVKKFCEKFFERKIMSRGMRILKVIDNHSCEDLIYVLRKLKLTNSPIGGSSGNSK